MDINDFLGSFFGEFWGESKNSGEQINKILSDIKKENGGKIKTKVEYLKKVTKTWVSDDGETEKQFTYYMPFKEAKIEEEALTLEELEELKEQAIEREDYEEAAKLRDKIEKLTKD